MIWLTSSCQGRANTLGVNRSGQRRPNPPQNRYLPLDYNLEWGGGCHWTHHGAMSTWHCSAAQNSFLFLYMFSMTVYNIWHAYEKNMVTLCKESMQKFRVMVTTSGSMFFHWTKIALMDRHECRVLSDVSSVQPLCRSRVDPSIIGLVAEEVEAEEAVGGVEKDLRNL